MKKIHIFIGLIIFLLTALPAYTLDFLQFDGGLLFIGNTEVESAPSPLLPTLGLTLPFPVLKHPFINLESGFLLFGTYYQFEDERATPVELEHRDFMVLGALVDTRIGIDLKISKAFKMGFYAGLALLIRAPIPLFEDIKSNLGPTLGYFYGKLRFLYPETQITAQMPILENFDIKISLRAYYPLFHLWDGEGLPFMDQFMIGGLIGVVYHMH